MGNFYMEKQENGGGLVIEDVSLSKVNELDTGYAWCFIQIMQKRDEEVSGTDPWGSPQFRG